MKFRNTKKMIDMSKASFDKANSFGVMNIKGVSLDKNRKVKINSMEITDFVRCGYLGIDSDPRIIEASKKALDDYKSIHWSCARTRLNFDIIKELEEGLGHLMGGHSITFPMVTLVNMGILPLIASGSLSNDEKPVMVFDRIAHSSLAFHKPVVAQETQVETIDHNNMQELERICQKNDFVCYVCDGLYSMGGAAPIKTLLKLQKKYKLMLYIDDAHGVSIYGKNGRGYTREMIGDHVNDKIIITSSLGKGFGASGGFVTVFSEEQNNIIRNFSQPYAFAASINVPAVGAALESLRIHFSDEITKKQNKLYSNLAKFDSAVETKERGEIIPIRFVHIGDEEATINICRRLLDNGFYTSAVFFPTVAKGKAGLRLSISSDHKSEDIISVCRLINKFITEETKLKLAS